jgi:hypothetical protein
MLRPADPGGAILYRLPFRLGSVDRLAKVARPGDAVGV